MIKHYRAIASKLINDGGAPNNKDIYKILKNTVGGKRLVRFALKNLSKVKYYFIQFCIA